MHNVFLVGLDDFNLTELRSIRQAGSCNFVGLLDRDLVRPRSGIVDFEALRGEANARLAAWTGSVDAIVSFWDFPSSALAAVLRNERGLPGPSNEAVAKCEHKYWSRLEQRAVVPELVPHFCAVDPFQADPAADVDIGFPLWIKPVKAHSSYLGFRIADAQDLERHLPEIREKIGVFGRPFDQYLKYVSRGEEIRRVTGHWCIAESLISAGRQCTLEGYVCGGEVRVYGVVDSIRCGRFHSSFARYQYPSRLPQRVQRRMIDAAVRVMTRLGYDDAPFDMEFFWQRRSDEIRLLEVNARLSRSHCPLFRMVDGASHHEVMIDLALGRRPDFPHRRGRHRVAAKFMLRFYRDGIVRRTPTAEEIARVRDRFPEARLRLLAGEGTRLTRLPFQDSYSFELAELFLGAASQRELLEKYERCRELLTLDVAPLPEVA